MSWMLILLIGFLLLVAFSIGFNLGLHGVIHLADKTANLAQKTQVVDAPSKVDLTVQSHTDQPNYLRKTIPETIKDVKIESSELYPSKKSSDETEDSRINQPDIIGIPSVKKADDTPKQTKTLFDYVNDIYYSKSVERIRNLEMNDHPLTSASYEFPILLMTCNRPTVLKPTIESLLKVKGVDRSKVIVSQDGQDTAVANVVHGAGLKLVQNLNSINRGVRDGGQRIAQHYKYSLSMIFDTVPDAEAVIVVEDDLLFSPDFYEYFQVTYPLLAVDNSLFAISAWNDNGFAGKVIDPYALHRTEFFPGLGWLITRQLYKNELEKKWPNEHWDHWLRSPQTHLGREIVYPEIPRTYHNGIIGTFMNLDTHNRYFRDIAYNQKEDISWTQLDQSLKVQYLGNAMKNVYEKRIEDFIGVCHHCHSFEDMLDTKGVACVWIDVDPDPLGYGRAEFEPIASFFGIWHEHKRGGHHGLHEFYWNDKYILLLNVHARNTATYSHLKPSEAKILGSSSFSKQRYLAYHQRKSVNLQLYPSTSANKNCDEVCAAQHMRCQKDHLLLINSCDVITKHFPCEKCEVTLGYELPAFVSPTADAQFHPKSCMVSTDNNMASCSAKHAATMRLCPCV